MQSSQMAVGNSQSCGGSFRRVGTNFSDWEAQDAAAVEPPNFRTGTIHYHVGFIDVLEAVGPFLVVLAGLCALAFLMNWLQSTKTVTTPLKSLC